MYNRWRKRKLELRRYSLIYTKTESLALVFVPFNLVDVF